MSTEISLLLATAATIGFFHTLLGPDHYVPFIVMGRARGWTAAKTALITALCGAGHVLSSVLIGLVGVALGIGVSRIEGFEGARGNMAAWALIAFGVTYCAWGLHRAARNSPHTHWHAHEDGTVHTHDHTHVGAHAHVHTEGRKALTPWVLFSVFVLGPCEPLIPILMYPAAKHSLLGLVLVTAVFGFVTIGTMLIVTLVSMYGARSVHLGRFERYTHALAGATICFCGLAIIFLGL